MQLSVLRLLPGDVNQVQLRVRPIFWKKKSTVAEVIFNFYSQGSNLLFWNLETVIVNKHQGLFKYTLVVKCS
jgi:hypothetical protein